MNYLILSLKWSPDPTYWKAVWWGPDNSGYTVDIDQAGRYTEEQIREKPGYYNDGQDTLAVPEDRVLAAATILRFASATEFTTLDKLQRLATENEQDEEPEEEYHAGP